MATTKPSGVVAYPIHVTLLYFTSLFRSRCITSGVSIVGYVPLAVEECSSELDIYTILVTSNAGGRTVRMYILHKEMAIVLAALMKNPLNDILYKDKNGQHHLLHPLLTSYCCDISEAKEMTSVISGTITKS